MKFNSLSFVVSVAYLVASVRGNVVLDSFPDTVYLGETYRLNWTATEDYAYDLWLIRYPPQEGWSKISVLAQGLEIPPSQTHFDWTVQSNLTAQGGYALWLQGTLIPANGSGWPNQTSTFDISHGPHKGVSGGVIAGIVIAALVVLALGVGAFLLFTWRKRRSATNRRLAAARATRLEPVVKGGYPEYQVHDRA